MIVCVKVFVILECRMQSKDERNGIGQGSDFEEERLYAI